MSVSPLNSLIKPFLSFDDSNNLRTVVPTAITLPPFFYVH